MLYHGTTTDRLPAILANGLVPQPFRKETFGPLAEICAARPDELTFFTADLDLARSAAIQRARSRDADPVVIAVEEFLTDAAFTDTAYEKGAGTPGQIIWTGNTIPPAEITILEGATT